MRETEAVWRFAEGGAFVERECLLFEAGVYADKGVTISEEDLQAIVRNSDALIPVKIEHLAESPFDNALGVVTRLRAEGARLWGTLRQPVEAWRLLQRTGARALWWVSMWRGGGSSRRRLCVVLVWRTRRSSVGTPARFSIELLKRRGSAETRFAWRGLRWRMFLAGSGRV